MPWMICKARTVRPGARGRSGTAPDFDQLTPAEPGQCGGEDEHAVPSRDEIGQAVDLRDCRGRALRRPVLARALDPAGVPLDPAVIRCSVQDRAE
jgi:hypothetical protein